MRGLRKMIISIQLLRFIAAAFVVLAHVIGEYAGMKIIGTFGVDIFFVISGFIISHITETGHKNFLKKRLIRIVPMYWFFTFTIAVIAFIAPELLRRIKFDLGHLACSLLFIPCWNEGTRFNPLLGLGWTINYEIFFYLLFFIAININNKYRELICSFFIIFFVFVLNVISFNQVSPISFYKNPIIFEFIIGMWIAVIYRKKSSYFNSLSCYTTISLIPVVVILFIYTSKFEIITFGYLRFLVWGSLSACLLIIFLSLEGIFRESLYFGRRCFLMLGDISYPLYLLHIYVIAIFTRVLEVQLFNFSVLYLILLSASSVLSYFIYSTFDIPIRRYLTYRLAK
jgi:peptidoglycan/LPS O-acetylase OafA/YrhL